MGAGSVAAAIADRLQQHRAVLLACFIASTALQGAMALVYSFAGQLALTVLVSMVWTGASIIGDAAVMAASTHVSAPSLGFAFPFEETLCFRTCLSTFKHL